MTLTTAIIDDEPLAAALLKSYADKTPFLNVKGVYNSAVMAMKDLREAPVDLIFLDIQMPELSGMEFAKLLPKQTRVVFTTAFSQYALEGYKVTALDYLLKPISYEAFLGAANKALDYFEQLAPQAAGGQATANNDSINDERFIFLKSEYKLVKVAFDDILFIENMKDYVRIFLDNGQKPIMSLMNMKTLEENLPYPEFMRTHRSYIVHLTKVSVIDRNRIVFGQNYIPISDSYKEEVQRYIDSHTL